MAVDVSLCPAPRLLERMLEEELAGSDRDAVEAHVEHCSSCQDQLDQIIGSAPSSSGSLTGARPVVVGPEPRNDFLTRLKRRPHGQDPQVPARLGQYEILATIAHGGMGAVYKARHVELGKVVALKILPAERITEANVARFKQEVRAMGRLEHPNIVAAHDAGEQNGVRYLVMAFVDGIDLARLVDCRGPLPVADASELARQAATGLQHAFERGLVHRDVKPQNLMLARDGTVKVLDLGLARSFVDAAPETLTAAGTMLGTADYLAPEQWDSPHAADVRADIYGLGCTLYHLLAGQPPFAGEKYSTVLKKMQAHQQVPHPPIMGPRPDTPAGLVTVLDRMLAKNPADRFGSPAELAEALRPFAAGANPAHLLAVCDTADRSVLNLAGVTPGPAKWETPLESVRPGRPATATRRRFRVLTAALALILAVVAVGLSFWPGLWRNTGTPSQPTTITELHGTHFRDAGTFHGDLRTSTSPVRMQDGVSFAADLAEPAYYYLIAFNPAGSKAGTEQLCLPDGAMGEGDPSVRPNRRADVRFPRDDKEFKVDATGLQVFVLASSSRPLPPYSDWRAKIDSIPWTGFGPGGAWRWQFDGSKFARFPQQRGSIEGAPKPLKELCDWFKARPEFDAVQVFAFPVTEDR